MDKRFQVFLSSTYVDLKDARQAVIQTLMQMDCIPSGMELFPAIDEDQFKFIKKIIDDCDYYILIIAGKYGSQATDGKSYTEKEYLYALETGKHVLAFVHENQESLPEDKRESDPTVLEKLSLFRKSVCSGRLVKPWNRVEDLPGLVALSLQRVIKIFPADGWIRANVAASNEILTENLNLRKSNDFLIGRVNSLQDLLSPKMEGIAEGKDVLEFGYSYFSSPNSSKHNKVTTTWDEVFNVISPYLLQSQNETLIGNILAEYFVRKGETICSFSSGTLESQTLQTLKIQFMALGFIKVEVLLTRGQTYGQFWTITELGKKKMLELRTVKRENLNDLIGGIRRPY